MIGAFSIYRSSAGSGKTRTLAKAYLTLALRFRADYFKHILAVTFTNKSTQEMKDRILAYLDSFARGEQSDLAIELQQALGLDPNTFQQYAQEAQAAILHKYDRFAISTIDAFFQKVIRSFTREAGLVGDYRLEVEQDAVLEDVIDNLIDELGTNRELTDWVVEFAKDNLQNERAWDVRGSLMDFAAQIFREEFKSIESEVIKATANRDYFSNLKALLRQLKKNYVSISNQLGQEALDIVRKHGWSASDFQFGNSSGLLTFLENNANAKTVNDVPEPKARVKSLFVDPKEWPHKSSRDRQTIISVAGRELVPRLVKLIDHYESDRRVALTADLLIQNLYVFGLVADISRKLSEYKDENNMMLLADAPKFLHGVIQDSDTPYVYEKVGSFYRNYLIDEFQDTSLMQWKNFLPLVTNSLDSGYTSMVVGDVKQAIYRWRGGDLELLQGVVEEQIGRSRVDIQTLNTNYRSAGNIVNFNNTVFQAASTIAAWDTSSPLPTDAYRDVHQQVARDQEGFVRVSFLPDSKDRKWKDAALEQLTRQLEELQDNGVAMRDIAILVRRNDEGQQIVNHLLQYRAQGLAKPGYVYDVVSNESLWLDGAASVNLLLAAMRYLLNPEDAIARGQLSYEYSRQSAPDRSLEEVFAVSNQAFFERLLPPAFAQEKSALKKLPLIELTETLIGIFHLGEQQGEIAYLLTFQHVVLEFYSRERNDLGAFLEWWEDNRRKKSVQLPAAVNAGQILTIHKSKGLQFRYVIIPFCAWSLDHDHWLAPTLWTRTEVPPFDKTGYVPVKYGSGLTDTAFADAHEAERTRVYLDNVNLLYVALTRAESGLIVMAPDAKTRNAAKTVASMLQRAIDENYDASAGWNAGAGELRIGSVTPSVDETASLARSTQLNGYPSFPWRDRLIIRKEGSAYFNNADNAWTEGILYGIHIHAILSRITYADDIPGVIAKLVLEGYMSADESTRLLPTLNELLANKKIAQWFDKQWEVHTEMPILLPSGAESRIDRLLINNRKAVVIDFKTGSPSRKDQKQVQEYVDILHQMNYADVEGYLLYIGQRQIIEVNSGKVKAAAKVKDRNQLGLEF